MKSIRLLIVEDEEEILARLKGIYRRCFTEHGFDSVTIEEVRSADEARELAKGAKAHPYDLVSLDVNLGDADITGMDVLRSLSRFQSAWMVALLTGVETDASLDDTVGRTKGESLRKRLRRDAYTQFPAERLLVVEKPSPTLLEDEARQLLENRVRQIALIYEEVARSRYMFRPIEVVSLERVSAPKGIKATRKFIETTTLHWQIRFNCGDLRTLEDRAGFRTLHWLLSRPHGESLTTEHAMVIEPKNEKSSPVTDSGENSVSAYFKAKGIAWDDLGEEEQNQLIATALRLSFKRYVELRKLQDENDLSADEEDELTNLIKELGPLSEAAETAYSRMQERPPTEAGEAPLAAAAAAQAGLHAAGGNYERREGGRGYDSPDRWNFSNRKRLAIKYLQENGFADLAQHVEDYIQPNHGQWSYNPPGDIEWTT